VINTEGAKTCMGRTKKEFSENQEQFLVEDEFKMDLHEEFQDDEFIDKEKPVDVKEEKKPKKKKEYGTVILVSKNKVYYDYNGQSRYKIGKFNVKVGDRIEV